mmetsp:Transcript_48886/g.81140  ORF Transcript_48886/g.81140 Transcript_48886/m.81140 type:complete len:285 (-) Transcript_48886:561-1415(-)
MLWQNLALIIPLIILNPIHGNRWQQLLRNTKRFTHRQRLPRQLGRQQIQLCANDGDIVVAYHTTTEQQRQMFVIHIVELRESQTIRQHLTRARRATFALNRSQRCFIHHAQRINLGAHLHLVLVLLHPHLKQRLLLALNLARHNLRQLHQAHLLRAIKHIRLNRTRTLPRQCCCWLLRSKSMFPAADTRQHLFAHFLVQDAVIALGRHARVRKPNALRQPIDAQIALSTAALATNIAHRVRVPRNRRFNGAAQNQHFMRIILVVITTAAACGTRTISILDIVEP